VECCAYHGWVRIQAMLLLKCCQASEPRAPWIVWTEEEFLAVKDRGIGGSRVVTRFYLQPAKVDPNR